MQVFQSIANAYIHNHRQSHTNAHTKRSDKQLSFVQTMYKIIYVAAEPSVEKVQIMHVAAEPDSSICM